MFKRRKPDDTPPIEPTASPARAPDTGLGVPPFRPAAPKEANVMARPPLPTSTPLSTPSVGPSSGLSSGPLGSAAGQPGSRPAMPPARGPAREPSEKRTLIVGRGISVQGTVQDAERLVVEGTVEASMIHAAELSVAQNGIFKGEAEVEEAEIAGTIDGTLTVRGGLLVRSTGRLLGTARCRRLQVEDGGQITGRIEMITEATPSPPAMAED